MESRRGAQLHSCGFGPSLLTVDVVTDDARGANHDAGSVIEHDSGADGGGRVDVHGEELGHARLEQQRSALLSGAALTPQLVRHAIRGHGLKAFEEEDWLDEADASGVGNPCLCDVSEDSRAHRGFGEHPRHRGTIGSSERLQLRGTQP